MDDVVFVGFSAKAVLHALCAEAEPGDRCSEEKTREWVRKSPIPMAAVVEGSIKFNTLACSHFTQGIRSIIAKVLNSSLRLGNGTNYDIDVIEANNPKLATLIKMGIKWLVLCWRLQYLYPDLFALMSQARNVFQAIGRQTHEVQGISQMISGLKRQAEAGEFDLAVVKRAIVRQKPWYAEFLDMYYMFVVQKGVAKMASSGRSLS